MVHTLWNQLLLEPSFNLFSILQVCYRHIEDVHEEVWCRNDIVGQTYRGFNICHFLTAAQVHSLWNQLLLRAFIGPFQHFADIYFSKSVSISVCRGYQVSHTYCQVSFYHDHLKNSFIKLYSVTSYWQIKHFTALQIAIVDTKIQYFSP